MAILGLFIHPSESVFAPFSNLQSWIFIGDYVRINKAAGFFDPLSGSSGD
jgi:hypothetical protein